jgi:hypothetical protein
MKFEILTAVKMSMLAVWVVMLCGLVEERTFSNFKAKDGDSIFL